MKKFGVTCTMIYNGYIEVEAETEEEALEKAQKKLSSKTDCALFPSQIGDFDFGECTADYADEIE